MPTKTKKTNELTPEERLDQLLAEEEELARPDPEARARQSRLEAIRSERVGIESELRELQQLEEWENLVDDYEAARAKVDGTRAQAEVHLAKGLAVLAGQFEDEQRLARCLHNRLKTQREQFLNRAAGNSLNAIPEAEWERANRLMPTPKMFITKRADVVIRDLQVAAEREARAARRDQMPKLPPPRPEPPKVPFVETDGIIYTKEQSR